VRAPLICGFCGRLSLLCPLEQLGDRAPQQGPPMAVLRPSAEPVFSLGGAVPEASKSRSDSGNQPLRRIGLGQKNCFQREFVWWR
jgi:hypothetical protein